MYTLTFQCADGTLIVKTKCKVCGGFYGTDEYVNQNMKCFGGCCKNKKVCKKCRGNNK